MDGEKAAPPWQIQDTEYKQVDASKKQKGRELLSESMGKKGLEKKENRWAQDCPATKHDICQQQQFCRAFANREGKSRN